MNNNYALNNEPDNWSSVYARNAILLRIAFGQTADQFVCALKAMRPKRRRYAMEVLFDGDKRLYNEVLALLDSELLDARQ